ncbi:MAG: hypothetical protein ACT4PV_09045 [Planctomycetaceae bacterium]
MRPFLLALWVAAFAGAAASEEDGLYAPPAEEDFGSTAAPGARERFAESLGILAARIAKDPADAAAYEETTPLARRLGREAALADRLRRTCVRVDLPAARLFPLRRALGHLLVEWARGAPGEFGGVFFFGMGDEVDTEALREEAKGHLIPVLAADPTDARSLLDLAEVLEAQDQKANAREVADLRRRAGGGASTPEPPGVPPLEGTDLAAATGALLVQAQLLETQDKPDFEAALALRRRALVLDFCQLTVPFEFEDRLYEPVSLLADYGTVRRSLTRAYRTTAGLPGTVDPLHYPPSQERRVELLEQLAREGSAGSCAALLGVIRRADSPGGLPVAAVDALVRARPAPLFAHLPALMLHALGTGGYTPHARRQLARLAALLKSKETAPALRSAVPQDRDLICPLDAALALAETGGAEDATLLLQIASDATRDVYFRRRAVDALGRLTPQNLLDLPEDPLLDVAHVAARCRIDRNDEAARARLLRALAREHDADDAAAYCADLGLVEALPVIEQILVARTDYAIDALRAAQARLRALGR